VSKTRTRDLLIASQTL